MKRMLKMSCNAQGLTLETKGAFENNPVSSINTEMDAIGVLYLANNILKCVR
jgi:hypothetical protein